MLEEDNRQQVYIGSDHAGFKSKDVLKGYLEGAGYAVTDLGCFSEDPCDYPDVAREVSEKVLEHEKQGALGVVVCGSGIGVSIAANKLQGIRAALAVNEKMAEMSRRHNNANVLALPGKEVDTEELKKILEKFLKTDFEKDQERHVRRVEKLNGM